MTESKAGSFQDEWQGPGLTPRQIKLTLVGVMFAMFLAALDQTIVATAIPQIMADLDGFDRVTWISTSYIVASTAVVLITGAVSDVYGRRGCSFLWVLPKNRGAGLAKKMADAAIVLSPHPKEDFPWLPPFSDLGERFLRGYYPGTFTIGR